MEVSEKVFGQYVFLLLNRVVTITGDTSDIVHTLVQISTTICTEGSKKPCLQLLQHDDVCRALVSKSACLLRSICQKTDVRITVNPIPLACSTERSVRIEGVKIEEGLKEILNLKDSLELSTEILPYSTLETDTTELDEEHEATVTVNDEKLSQLLNRGCLLKDLETKLGVKIQVLRHEGQLCLKGELGAVQMCHSILSEDLPQYKPSDRELQYLDFEGPDFKATASSLAMNRTAPKQLVWI